MNYHYNSLNYHKDEGSIKFSSYSPQPAISKVVKSGQVANTLINYKFANLYPGYRGKDRSDHNDIDKTIAFLQQKNAADKLNLQQKYPQVNLQQKLFRTKLEISVQKLQQTNKELIKQMQWWRGNSGDTVFKEKLVNLNSRLYNLLIQRQQL